MLKSFFFDKNHKTTAIFYILLIFSVFCLLSNAAIAETAELVLNEEDLQQQLVGEGIIIADSDTSKVLFEKNADQIMEPASLTKILTALIALENCDLDEEITAGINATGIEPTALYLAEGEVLTMEDALYSLLLHSANDSAIAIAEHIAGSVEQFSKMMNEKAKQLGAVNSHFVNPNGLTADKHYSTPHDMLLISQAAMKNETFRKIVATRDKEISRTRSNALTDLSNRNQLLAVYDGMIGIKTGYTEEAGFCLASAAQRGDRELIAIVMNSGSEAVWNDTQLLLDYGFNNFNNIVLVNKGDIEESVKVKSGMKLEIDLITADSLTVTVGTKTNKSNITSEIVLDETAVKAPIEKNQQLGTIYYNLAGQEIGHIALLAADAVKERPFFLEYWFFIVLIIVGMIIVRSGIKGEHSSKRNLIKSNNNMKM